MYTKSQVSKITGLTPRQVTFYTEEGLVHPLNMGAGPGIPRLYSKEDVQDLVLTRLLVKYGTRLDTIKTLLDKLKSMGIKGGIIVLVDDTDIYRLDDFQWDDYAGAIVVNMTKLFEPIESEA
jgi:DNA-binding transcriptional MerR regulator